MNDTATNTRSYSNPRLNAVMLDWPYGRFTTTATFEVETHPKRGQRTGRTTVNPKNGRINKTKYNTYSGQQRIVDGDDGRTYIAELSGSMISIRSSDMKHDEETAHCGGGYAMRGHYHRDDGTRYADLLELFADSTPPGDTADLAHTMEPEPSEAGPQTVLFPRPLVDRTETPHGTSYQTTLF